MIPTVLLTPQGKQPTPYRAESLAEAAANEPQGVYTIARTFQRDHALLLDDHLDRLERSAQLEGIPLTLNRAALRTTLRNLIAQSGYAESRFRLSVPRANPDHLYIALEPFTPIAAEVIARGVRVVTVYMARHNPAAKSTTWATERKAAVDAFAPGIYEGILVSPTGALLEGTSSNFYAVAGGTLYTADDDTVLGGIARRIVLTVAHEILPVEMRPVQTDQPFEEAFLSSASRGIVPIVEIDGRAVGSGQPGAVTLQLRSAYEVWAAAHLEPI